MLLAGSWKAQALPIETRPEQLVLEGSWKAQAFPIETCPEQLVLLWSWKTQALPVGTRWEQLVLLGSWKSQDLTGTGAPCGASISWSIGRSPHSTFSHEERKWSSISITAHHRPARRAVMSSSCSSKGMKVSVFWISIFDGIKTSYPKKVYNFKRFLNN